MINEVDAHPMTMKVSNARTDFFGLDQKLVEMIPFALWYDSKYRTVITITDGSVTATHDVIVPTLFCAENAIYVGKAVGSVRYRKAITSYFENRGANTVPQFIALTVMNVDSVYECLEEQLQKYGAHDLIINCVPNRGYVAALAIGKLMEKYYSEISVVQYLPNKGIVSYSEDKNIGIGIDNKSYSLSEFIQLMGGRVTNEYASLYDSSQYEDLAKLFRNYCDSFKVLYADNQLKNFNPWAHMTKLLSNVAKDDVFEEHRGLKGGEKILSYQGRFSEKVFFGSMIGKTMKQLQEYRIIQNYTEQRDVLSVVVKFDCVNQELVELLQMTQCNGFMR